MLGAREAFGSLDCSVPELTVRDDQSDPESEHWPEGARLYSQARAGLPAGRPGTRPACAVGACGSWGPVAVSGSSPSLAAALCCAFSLLDLSLGLLHS